MSREPLNRRRPPLASGRPLSVGRGALPLEAAVPDSDLVTFDHLSESPVHGSTPKETYRGVLEGRTLTHESATVIVTRQGLGIDARVWLTFCGALRTTVVMTDRETAELRELLDKATKRRT